MMKVHNIQVNFFNHFFYSAHFNDRYATATYNILYMYYPFLHPNLIKSTLQYLQLLKVNYTNLKNQK